MADLVSNVVSQLTILLRQEAAFLRGVSYQVDGVKTELKRMEVFLKAAESRRRRRGDERVENWIREIRDAAYEVEDIIDRVKFTAERQRQRGGGFMGSLSRYLHKPPELFTIHEIGSEIGRIKDKIRSISDSRGSYGIPNLGEGGTEKSSDWDENLEALRQFPPHFYDDADVVGLGDDKGKLVKLLVDPENKNRSVISIVGMGGLGKTTLARRLYNDPAIKEQFETFAWVSVSQNYRVIQLLKDIMKEVMGLQNKDIEQMGEGPDVRQKLLDFLGGRKYLVAMDDVWDVNVWTQMEQVLPNGNNGSRILLTTRYIKVARFAEKRIPPHEMQHLNDRESLELFRRKAIPPNQDVPAEMEELAQKLAKRCGGLPLALVVLGGLLSTKDRTYGSWLKVAESMNWKSTKDGQQCLDILGLSYQDLPYLLKSCFLYIAAFPEDSTISVSKLVRLWIAEGFVVQEQRQTMEETARDWMDELVQRRMIQVVERSAAHERVKSIRIHDMLRDFGLSEARMDGFLHVCSSDGRAASSYMSSHRAAFHNHINDEVGSSSPHLRTLLGFDLNLKDATAAGKFLKGLNLLRVLDLEGVEDLEELPKQIGSMIHLRYLGLRGTGLKKLPSSIGHLLNLQTLDVTKTYILWLPKSFWKIRTLRHVYMDILVFLRTPIIGDHKNLQTLQIKLFIDEDVDVMYMSSLLRMRFIQKWVTAPGFTEGAILNAWDRVCAEPIGKALEKMDSLVSLTLELTGSIPGDVLIARAPNWHKLHSLNLSGKLVLKPQQLLDSIQFPPNITKLILSFSEFKQDPMPMLEKLENLRLLELHSGSYVGKSMSCSAGGFPQLQQLTLDGLRDLEEWRVEIGAMHSLTHLTIQACGELKMLPEGLQHMTTLQELKLIEISREFNERVKNEDGYKVQHIPSIIYENEKL